ncbi:MAG: FAD-binding protein [Curvibacter lanceolatus]|jgi:succinate dehydrogenase/fumarate reductase flavoprotein subunit|uniref:FAD-dependent oxidoreductase n=1 Tax=Curvibacter lanceolatus TaxID=86182 RepID=UPI0003A77304|nr:FAD-binding protein [Curvibacter lanceolatus]MBV5291805.1 FAD-binding protein [Curvibacter lanceolatus]
MALENSLSTDVLVIGGGMAGAWAALGAVRTGARVTLVDKGYCGTSGVTATAGPGHWWVPPAEREQAVRQRAANAGGLAEAPWMRRIIETTWEHLPTLARHYRFAVDANGHTIFRALRGPEYMKALRAMLNEAGVKVLDHHPALELLRDDQGRVAGAAGLRRVDQQPWRISAGAVVLASGGCAFLSKLLGADNNTGDGLLMAAEVGAELYCQADALYVDPSVFERVQVNADTVRASGLLGVYRRDSGWDEWADDPRYVNQHWRMEEVFARGRELARDGAGGAGGAVGAAQAKA